MNVKYRWCKQFTALEVGELFRSVEWSSGHYPEEVRLAMLGSDAVCSAWDDGKLVGLMNAISDGTMTVYFHYLAVHPDYQGKGIGTNLVERMLERYSSFLRKMLVSYDKEIGFYQRFGFEPGAGKTPMYITTLTT
jgi:ribosomal protein S18 acetylase RimI-like enzyme